MRFIILLVCLVLVTTNGFGQKPQLQNAGTNSTSEILSMDFSKKFYVIAHRGASAYFPENTIPAFEAAIEMNADMIELDVLLSKDNVPVVFHDESLDQKTDGKGLVIDYTYEELSKFDAGSWFDSKFEGLRIPTLQEVLELTNGKILVNIEIKPEAVRENVDNGVVNHVLKLVEELSMQEQVVISSFDYRVVERVKKYDSKIKVALLYEREQSYGRSPKKLVKDYAADAFNFSVNELADNWVQELKVNKVPFFVYTINDEDLMESVLRKGARGIFTDKPDVLSKIVDQVLVKKWN